MICNHRHPIGLILAALTVSCGISPILAQQGERGYAHANSRFDVDFPGGALSDYVDALRKARPDGAANIIVMPAAKGLQVPPVRLVAASPQKLELGSILLTNRVEALSRPEAGRAPEPPLNGVLYNDLRLVPRQVDRFFKTGYAFLYVQVWFPKGCDKATVNANFIRDGQIVKRLDPRQVENPRQGYAEYGTIFALEGFEPGEYTLQIHAIERDTKTYDIRRTSFRIQEAF